MRRGTGHLPTSLRTEVRTGPTHQVRRGAPQHRIYGDGVARYEIKPLTPATWDAFAQLVERHNGVWGGCWCTWFHADRAEKGSGAEGNRALKHQLVDEGRAHAALVFDGDAAVGWCQYGSPDELPRIYHRREYETGLAKPPDYRLTCLFVDKAYRRKGVATAALAGALDLIRQAGGGVVEAYPQDTQGQRVSASFLYNGTRSLFEHAGFSLERPKGKSHCVMSVTVARPRRKRT
jgi:GNAT superfamily N-acetyltransferase